jgi:DME family drug/metabolite transporter
VFGRQLAPKVTTAELTALRFGAGLPAAAVMVAAGGDFPSFTSLHAEQWGALLGLALVPSLAALLVYYRGLQTTPAAVATLGEIAFPVTALVVGYLAFGSALTATQWVGTALLVAIVSVMVSVSGTGQDETLGVAPGAGTLSATREGWQSGRMRGS